MQAKLELSAEPRSESGRSQVGSLRTQGITPGILYGKEIEAIPVKIESKILEKTYEQAGENTLVYLNVGKETYPTIIAEITKDVVSDEIIHVDFHKVRLDKKITAEVPLIFVGESLAVKEFGGILVKNITEVEVESLPQDLPHELEIDISSLVNFESKIHIADIKLIGDISIKNGADEIVVLVQEPISEAQLEEELSESTGSVEDVKIESDKGKEEEEAGGESETKETPEPPNK
ncbi:MAG: 50S ribosomal protein L25 [Candidatus Yanofskybacteria bacterium CG10_big_fil_rev_8_21_14_0_10_46_23]|uniref:Large ribosomal subunit protein bL25 n=1 Tax=Candidatus Yanofskybacteria bacterium CG10_big_fil_rev_8_21_14_0_10_46_23 TaxID=1975098 RepID=A0A2H0R463_9BACT|nr:MAG: 50S ribosomal protein L25 [Candidatus Yanofskybacteria bacterium CG10_big_fil_rev_8_21_14_0_10_46_23]